MKTGSEYKTPYLLTKDLCSILVCGRNYISQLIKDHPERAVQLLASLNALIAKGHTVVIIEHNPDVIRSADWVIDLGPEGGAEGGRVVFEGTPADLEKCAASYTGQFLAGQAEK